MSGRLEVILWRDIPAQVIARAGRDVHRIELGERFQLAIDRAATRAGLTGTDEYLAEWRKERRVADGDVAQVAEREADRLDAEFYHDVLAGYVENLAHKP